MVGFEPPGSFATSPDQVADMVSWVKPPPPFAEREKPACFLLPAFASVRAPRTRAPTVARRRRAIEIVSCEFIGFADGDEYTGQLDWAESSAALRFGQRICRLWGNAS
jgi:hypothetical protein